MRIVGYGLAFAVLAALGVVLVWYLAGDQSPQGDRQSDRATPVTVAEVRRGNVEVIVEAVGSLEAREQVIVTSQVRGIVRAIHFEESAQVQQGEVLVELDTDQEQAELAEIVAERDEALRQYQRGLELREDGLIAQAELDELEAAYQASDARVQTIRANIADRDIEAPFAGRIGLRHVSPGALLQPGTEVATLTTVDPIDLNFEVPAEWLPQIKPGLTIRTRTSGIGDKAFRGTVRLIDTEVDPQTQSVAVEAELPNPEGLLRPGLFMTVELVIEERENAVLVPEEAIVLEGQEKYLYVVRDDNTVERTAVETGQRRKGVVEIVQGVEPGAKVVVGGLQKISDGQKVQPQLASGG